nr:MAG TPA: hypothetical protein [Caudoviricetes sp.]DAL16789.1 MAG TPA_asm: hypothetical protein [Caudoviricetes sp.]
MQKIVHYYIRAKGAYDYAPFCVKISENFYR